MGRKIEMQEKEYLINTFKINTLIPEYRELLE